MIVKLNSNLFRIFSGCYESRWVVDICDDNGDWLEVDYDNDEFNKSIVNTYKDLEKHFTELLKEKVPFFKKLSFLDKFTSPSYYNYSTDRVYFNVTIDEKKLKKTLGALKDNDDFNKFLRRNYKSYEGFISFTPYTWQGIKDEINEKGDEFEQAIGAVITFLAGNDLRREIEWTAWDLWQGNGYGGLDYKILNG